MSRLSRRRLLKATGGLAAGTTLAGCSGDGGSGDGGSSDGSSGDGSSGDGSSGDGGSDGQSGGDQQTYQYNLATASSGGAWAVQGAGLAELWNELDQVEVTAINTAGGGENPILIRDGEAGLGFQSGSNLYAVLNGEGPYEEAIDLQSVFRTNTNPVWYAVREGSDMTTMADLDGADVAVGPRGSNANYESQIMFDHIGIDINEQYLSFSDAANAMANNQIDSMIVYGLIPAVQQLAEQTDIRPLKYADAYDSMLEEFPWAVESAFPAGAVDWYDEGIPLIGKDIYVVTRPDIPEEFTYQITKHTMDNIESAQDIHFLFSGMSVEGSARNLDGTIEIHSGSRQYFEEAGAL
jgi:TRAP transporter TAXI family solute receptor